MKLRKILDRTDLGSDMLMNRKMSSKHNDEIEVLLEHLVLLISDLRFDAEATRRELFEVRCLLEE